MKIWLITVGEPLPIDEKSPRYLRTGILARRLAEQGHEVTWWSSTFNHSAKLHRAQKSEMTSVSPPSGKPYRLALLHGRAYRRNLSWQRILNHREVAREFTRLAADEVPPQVILCSFPTIELSEAATRYGARHGVKVVLDVRDLWPDIFTDILPRLLRSAARVPLFPMIRSTRKALQDCHAIVGISKSYLKWGLGYAGRAQRPSDRVIPLGYEAPNVAETERETAAQRLLALGVDPKKVIAWFVGVFGTTYDLDTVLDAARALQAKGNTRVQFVLSGDGERAERWKKKAEGLGNVVYTGWINGAELAWMREVASVGLAAYAVGAPQSLPNKLFEYLSAGLPVLSSLTGEAVDLLADHGAGLSYAAGDAGDLERGLLTYADEEALRKKTAKKGLRLYQEQFSPDRVYQGYIDYLNGVAAEARA